jgi:hypothetical protein
MHPPRQMRAIVAKSSSHPYSGWAARMSWNP